MGWLHTNCNTADSSCVRGKLSITLVYTLKYYAHPLVVRVVLVAVAAAAAAAAVVVVVKCYFSSKNKSYFNS